MPGITGNTTYQYQQQLPWVKDFLNREHLLAMPVKLDRAQFNADDAVVVTVGAAGAALNATSIPVTPTLTGPIPSGTLLYFGAGKYARLTAAAPAGASSLAVEALPAALTAGNTAVYQGSGIKIVQNGTVVGRTIAERDAGVAFGPAVDTDDEIYIVAFDVTDLDRDNDATLVRKGTLIAENYLPGWSGFSTALKTAIRNRYECIRSGE